VEWAADEATLRRLPLHIVHAAERWTTTSLHAAPGCVSPSRNVGAGSWSEAAEPAAKARPASRSPPNWSSAHRRGRSGHRAPGRRDHRPATAGLGRLHRHAAGSTAFAFAAMFPVPVIVVRGEVCGRRGEVLAGVDLSRTALTCCGTPSRRPHCAADGSGWSRLAAAATPLAVTRDRGRDPGTPHHAIAPWRRSSEVGVVEQTPVRHPAGELTPTPRPRHPARGRVTGTRPRSVPRPGRPRSDPPRRLPGRRRTAAGCGARPWCRTGDALSRADHGGSITVSARRLVPGLGARYASAVLDGPSGGSGGDRRALPQRVSFLRAPLGDGRVRTPNRSPPHAA